MSRRQTARFSLTGRLWKPGQEDNSFNKPTEDNCHPSIQSLWNGFPRRREQNQDIFWHTETARVCSQEPHSAEAWKTNLGRNGRYQRKQDNRDGKCRNTAVCAWVGHLSWKRAQGECVLQVLELHKGEGAEIVGNNYNLNMHVKFSMVIIGD